MKNEGKRWRKALEEGVVMKKINWSKPELINFLGPATSYGNCVDVGSVAEAVSTGPPCNTHGGQAAGNCITNGASASGDNCAAGGMATVAQCSSNGTSAAFCASMGNTG